MTSSLLTNPRHAQDKLALSTLTGNESRFARIAALKARVLLSRRKPLLDFFRRGIRSNDWKKIGSTSRAAKSTFDVEAGGNGGDSATWDRNSGQQGQSHPSKKISSCHQQHIITK